MNLKTFFEGHASTAYGFVGYSDERDAEVSQKKLSVHFECLNLMNYVPNYANYSLFSLFLSKCMFEQKLNIPGF